MPSSSTNKITHSFPAGITPADLQTSAADLKDRNRLLVAGVFGLTSIQICYDITAPIASSASPRFRIYIEDELLGLRTGRKDCKGILLTPKNPDGSDIVIPAGETQTIALKPVFVGNRNAAIAIEVCETDTIIFVSGERISWLKA